MNDDDVVVTNCNQDRFQISKISGAAGRVEPCDRFSRDCIGTRLRRSEAKERDIRGKGRI